MTAHGWTYCVGTHPDQVEVFEDLARKGIVYLRWRVAGATPSDIRKYRNRSLGFAVKDARGRLLKDRVADAQDAAKAKYHELIGRAPTVSDRRPLTISEGMAIAFDANRGRWAKVTPHQKEIRRALRQACSVWGADRAWITLTKADFRELWRKTLKKHRSAGESGHRVTELTVLRVLTLAGWLREEDAIPPVSWLPWQKWRDEVREDVGEITIQRPTFTLEEMRALLRTCRDVDPRWELLLELGAGLRLGQVCRTYRSWLQLETGRLDLRKTGRKSKRGTVRLLTQGPQGQLAAFRKAIAPGGYLEALEAQYEAQGTDYPLFVGGRLPRRADGQVFTQAKHAVRAPIGATALVSFFAANEIIAGITHQAERGWTGLRRITVTKGKEDHISREALKELGGWATSQMADEIYADEEAQGPREEARDVFAKIRGEAPRALPEIGE